MKNKDSVRFTFVCNKCGHTIVDYVTTSKSNDAHIVTCPKCGDILYNPFVPPDEEYEPDFDLEIERLHELDNI